MQIIQNLNGLSFERGYHTINARGIAIVGISPGNSYFTQSIVEELLTVCHQTFSKIYICIPCSPSLHTYKARGYSEIKTKNQVRKDSNKLKSIVKKSMSKFHMSQFHLLDWQTEIEMLPAYNEKLEFIYNLYMNSDEFYQDIQSTVYPVLSKYFSPKGIAVTSSMLDEGSKYILKEFAFLLASPSILNSSTIATVYHRKWPIWNSFASGKYTKDIPSIGDVIITRSSEMFC